MFRILLAIVCGALGIGVQAHPQAGLIDVSVRDLTEARTLPVYQHEGRRYVAGRPGNEYQLTLRNPTDADVLAVVSVDGVNVITGETASWEQSGYVVPARGEVAIRGWRKSLGSVASFFFTQHANSYAARTGRPHDVGVIGVAVFRPRVADLGIARRGRESTPQPSETPAERTGAEANEAQRAQAASPAATSDSTLGTGHGRTQISRARYTTFQRASNTPNEVVAIQYDTHANLAAMGVVQPVVRRPPSPFPGRFVPDPN